jgi:hypothetical protein
MTDPTIAEVLKLREALAARETELNATLHEAAELRLALVQVRNIAFALDRLCARVLAAALTPEGKS